MKTFRSFFVWISLLVVAGLSGSLPAASVGTGGYTNNFSTQPPSGDWSTFSIGSGQADFTTSSTVDGAVTNVAAGSITSQSTSDAADPPVALGLATWSSTGLYLQTRPTGNGATLLMCTLVNNLGNEAIAANISYNLARSLPVAEEVDGHRAYYSLSGAAGSWMVITQFSTAAPGTLSATINVTWPNGSPLYLLWADDNGSGTPDTVYQIDNFSVTATPGVQTAVMITNQPQSQMVGELQPVTFIVGLSGYLPPTVQWYTNNVAVAGATNVSYNIPSTPLAYNGLNFRAIAQNVASNVSYSVTSSVATLTVNADNVRPVLLGAVPSGTMQIVASFSERLALSSVTNLANYSVTGPGGNLTISSVTLDATQTNLLFNVSAMTPGNAYTLTVSGVTDQSVAANSIIANSQAQFTAASFTLTDIGNPAIAGSATSVGDGYNVTAGGTNISGAADQFSFNQRLIATDFDLKMRVASLSLSDTWAKAGLMARDTLNANSRFAGAFATPSVAGAFFQSRSTAGAAAASAGLFPINYPYTWLRLRRVGDVFTGYASVNGENWSQLGSVTLAGAPRPIYVGMALVSANAGQSTSAQFRDIQDVVGGTIGSVSLPVEPLGPSTRRTGLAITEIMYKPAARADGRIVDFIEIYNSNPYWEDISGYKITGDIDFTFPPNTILQGGAFLALAKVPADIQAVYGISNVIGPYTNNLTTEGTIRLRSKENAVYLEIPYSNQPPWPLAADGTGHSLVLARPSFGEGNPEAWAISDTVGGTPGTPNGASGGPLRSVVINEFLANTDPPLLDYIELYNHGNQPVNISGCFLSDEARTNKFIVPTNTVIPARGFVVFDQSQLPFGLSSGGETIYFRSADNTRVIDAVQFEAQGNGVSSGRYPDGASTFYPLATRTPGTNNSGILIRDVVINEIMYDPIGGNDDEYVELYNKSTNAVNLGGWRFVAGIDYTFPSNAVLGADRYVVVAKNVTNLLARYANLNATNTFGNYDGALANRGERLALGMPDFSVTTNSQGQVSTNIVYVVVDEVTYGIGGNWGKWANEGGSSLELIDSRSNHRLAHNWTDSDESAKAPWTTVSGTGIMEQGAGDTANFIELLALGEGEYLVDNVEVLQGAANMVAAGNSTLDAGIGGWLGRGTHVRSQWSSNQGVGGSGCLLVRSSARGDTMHNRALCTITVPSGVVTLRAQVRWLKGWPEILLRLHGNYMEAFGRLQLPATPGTPGARNSQAVNNAPPAIYEVTHSPVLPAANEAAVVTARVHDPDGISSLVLNYRIDPSSTFIPVTMADNGTGGDAIANDGLFSGTIPGQNANTLVAFQVTATDSQGAARLFPLQPPGYTLPFECLVRFGDPILSSAFGTYRQWYTQGAVNTWQNRPALSNEKIYGTFVYGNTRVIYNISAKYSSSPYHQGQHSSPVTGNVHYTIELPLDDQCLGTENWNKVHAPGNSAFDENTNQREQIGYWFARQMGLPWNYRRFVNMIVNGVKKGSAAQIMEDTERGGDDFVDSRFPDDRDGALYKIQPWFEVDDGTALTLGFQNRNWCTLNRYSPGTNAAVHFTPRYRQNWLVRAANQTANDFSQVWALVDAANTPGSTGNWAAHTAAMEELADMEEWMRIFATCHAVGDWDHFGTQNAQNMYGYKPQNGKWTLMIWDFNILMGNSGSWGPGQNLFVVNGADTRMPPLYSAGPPASNPKFRRMFLRGLKEMAGGPMQANRVEPVIDARQAAMVASGVTVPVANVNTLKTWISDARNSILTQVAAEDTASLALTVTNQITASSNLVTLSGLAPVEMAALRVNGVEYPLTWSTVRNWTLQIPVSSASNVLSLQGYDLRGNALPGPALSVTVYYTGPIARPEQSVVINEIMYNPKAPDASFVEVLNNAPNFAFNLSNWRLNGLGYTFPPGLVLGSRQIVVLAKQRSVFASTYGLAAFDQFNGELDLDGETLSLIQPGLTPAEDVIVDQVRYEAVQPWPTNANGAGPSLQLIDSAQDNARVSNWSDGSGWRFYSTNGNPGTLPAPRLFMLLDKASDVYIDNISLVAGTVPELGPNLLSNGDFESALSGPWIVAGSHSNSLLSTEIKFAGNASLHIVATAAGTPATNNSIWQDVVVTTNTTYTLSYWYLTNAITTNKLTTRLNSSFRPENTIRPVFSTPGAANSTAAPLPPYPPLWLNEVQPQNLNSITDNVGDRDPWLELYNAGTNTLNLEGFYLANNYSNLTQWAFPPGASIAPGQFKIIWLDGEPGESAGSSLHTSFTIPHNTGAVALSRNIGLRAQLVDYLNYAGVAPSLSYGDYPDGQPFHRRVLYTPSPGATNAASDITLFINEWLADNTLFDDPDEPGPNFEDWFELYNPGDTPVDLSGFYLTDTNANKTQFQIPNGTVIPAGGFLLVWADGEPGQNTSNRIDLHANFNLRASGEFIGLYAPDGSPIDEVTFGAQANNISQGRWPDGAASRYFMNTPTPKAANVISGGNTPPNIAPISDQYVSLGQSLNFTVMASDTDVPAQTLTYTLLNPPPGASIGAGNGQFSWTPTPAQTPSTNSITVRVDDNGAPPLNSTRAFTVYVLSAPRATVSLSGNILSISFGTQAGRHYRVEYKNDLNDDTWITLQDNLNGTGGPLTITDNIGASTQRFYQIVQLD